MTSRYIGRSSSVFGSCAECPGAPLLERVRQLGPTIMVDAPGLTMEIELVAMVCGLCRTAYVCTKRGARWLGRDELTIACKTCGQDGPARFTHAHFRCGSCGKNIADGAVEARALTMRAGVLGASAMWNALGPQCIDCDGALYLLLHVENQSALACESCGRTFLFANFAPESGTDLRVSCASCRSLSIVRYADEEQACICDACGEPLATEVMEKSLRLRNLQLRLPIRRRAESYIADLLAHDYEVATFLQLMLDPRTRWE